MDRHPFMSDEWIAEVHRIKQAYIGDDTDQPIVVNGTVTGAPFADGVLKMHSSHGPIFGWEPGHVEGADFAIEIDWAVARELVMDRSPNVLERALGAREILVTGDVDQFRDWWHSRVDDRTTEQLEEEIRAVTE